MTLTPAQAGFIKQIFLLVAFAVLTYVGDASHLNGIVSPVVAGVIAALAGALESKLKAGSDNTTALFGAVKVTRK